jgi:flagellum-specific ATP synthase
MQSGLLEHYFDRLDARSPLRWRGRVTHAAGSLIESDGPFCSLGECCEIESEGTISQGEVIGFRGTKVLSMPLDKPSGIRYGDHIFTWGARPSLRVGDDLLGRVIDGQGNALDGKPAYAARMDRPVDGSAPLPLERVAIREPLGCGVRGVDAFVTCGRGQRMGIFGGSGVGKSTLIGMMARNTSADMTVLALIGERGREVREFLEDALGTEGRRRSVVVVSTSDQSPLLRIRAALAATTIAEYFCLQGRHVLMVVDSLTRFAMAQREVGLAAGEPPTAKGYTPSVFSLLARLIERAGRFGSGSITAFYTVLMEGDDQQDPLVDAVRSLLDGHVVLDRSLAARNQYPPIALNDSLSRLMSVVTSQEHARRASELRALLAAYRDSEDLIRIGAYQAGTDPQLDRAIAVMPQLRAFLEQKPGEAAPVEETIAKLLQLPS